MEMQDKDELELTYKMYEKVTKKIRDKNTGCPKKRVFHQDLTLGNERKCLW